MSLGEFVKARRFRLGLNQSELAARIGNREKNWVSQLENGKIVKLPDAETVARLAAALECSQSDVVQAAGYLTDAEAPAVVDDPWSLLGKPVTPEQFRKLLAIVEEFRNPEDG